MKDQTAMLQKCISELHNIYGKYNKFPALYPERAVLLEAVTALSGIKIAVTVDHTAILADALQEYLTASAVFAADDDYSAGLRFDKAVAAARAALENYRNATKGK